MKFDLELKKQIRENIKVKKSLVLMSKSLINATNSIYQTLKNNGKVFLCGNGGSAADAQHLAAEFIVRLRPQVNRNPIPALTLAQDTSTLTATGNDYGFENIFLRPFKALAKKDDVLICISTSGNSKNILKVLKEAKKQRIYSISFLGKRGGQAKLFSSNSLIISSNNTARIQECHIFLGHFILEKVEDFLADRF